MEIEEFNDVDLFGGLHQLCLQNISFTSIVAPRSPWRMMKFNMLNHLTVCSCNQLKYLLPLYVLEDVQQLKTIDISDCEQLEHVFVDEKDTQTTKSNVMEVLPLLHSLTLINLPELALICSGDAHFNSRSLIQMTIENCPKFIFTFVHNLRSIKEEEPSKKKSKEMILTPSILENLNLRRVDHLKNMCEDPKVSFEHLTYLQLKNCNKLEYLFSLSMAQSLSCLQELRIISCERIKQIIKRETEETTRANSIEFLQLETLILDQLPKFTGSSNQDGDRIRWFALDKVQVTGCPNIKKSMLGIVDSPLFENVTVANCSPWEYEDLECNIGYLFKLPDKLSKLQNLKIEDSKQLKNYMEMELQETSFTQLKTVEALQCDNELNKLLSILLHRSYKLELLTVERCESLEQVFDLTDFVAEEPGNSKFPNLNTMQLLCLHNLRCIWNKDPRGIMEFGRLVKLEIIECGLSKSPLSTALVEELVLLEALKIESCEMIEQLIEDDTEVQESSFRNLKDLQLASLPNLIKLNSGHCNVKFPNLLRLRIENCPILNAFTARFLSNQMLTIEGTSRHVPADENMVTTSFSSDGNIGSLDIPTLFHNAKGALPRLKHLKLVSASTIKRLVWWTQFDMSLIPLQSLETMEIVDCNDLHDLFAIDCLHDAELFGGFLPELRQLHLRNLDSLTSLVGLNSHGRILNFKMLNGLIVCSCKQLKYLLPVYVLKDLQELKTIDIRECEQLEHVFVDEQDTQRTESNVMEVLPLLHSLTLINLPELSRICSVDAHFTSRSLTQMTVESCPKFIFTFVDNLRSIKEEGPSKKKSKEVSMSKKKSKEMILTPSILENLNLHGVDRLKNMCEDPKVSFKHLTYLQLKDCNKLEYLFSLSMAESLSCLQELRIISCERIKQIVKIETEETWTEKTVEFLLLKTLFLDQLPKFTGSSDQDGASVRWLALETVDVARCSNIQKSMLGTVDRPLLKAVTVLNCPAWESGDKESNIGYLFDLTDELAKLEKLIIKDSKQLKIYMEMELQESSFRQLKTMEALQCDNKLNTFLSILLRRSYNLERLTIKSCELLQHVLDLTEFIAEEQRNIKFPKLNTMQLLCLRNLNCIWNKDPRGVVELGNLVKLEIIECGLRKSPLSTALVEKLVHLEELKIESCEMIEQVIEDDTEMQESSFRNLKDFQLASLPNLIKLNSGLCNVKFPELQSLRIENCPIFLSKLTLTIEGTSDHVPQIEMMHACPKLRKLKLAGLEMEDIWQGQDYRIPLCDLKDVEVDSFSKLRYMWIAKSENLETLVVRNCNSLGRLVLPSNCFNMKEIKISDCNILEEICIDQEQQKMDEKTIPPLESIVLENLPKFSFFTSETCEFPSLRKLRIVNCPTLVTLPKNVSEHSELVLFEDVMEESRPGIMKIPPQLESLELVGFTNLQLWAREPKIPVFKKLTSLKIINCGRLEELFSISVAEHLSSLKLLALYGCVDMVHVLQGVRGTGLQVVVFKKLETLVLKHLPRLTSFCEEDVDFGEWPELKMVRVEDIPNMNTFVKKPLSTPKLKQVHVTYIKKCWLGDLNQTITDLHENHDKLKNEVWESDQSSTRHPFGYC